MATTAALRAADPRLSRFRGVASNEQLHRMGFTRHAVAAQLDAGRWQRIGRAVVLHNGTPTRNQLLAIALLCHGPGAVLTSFTALTGYGLLGWDRPEIHLVGPRGVRRYRHPMLTRVVVHESTQIAESSSYRAEVCTVAAVRAAVSLDSARHACGLLAALVQQSRASPAELRAALTQRTHARHRAAMLRALEDIEQGAQALSEIDFVRLCRRHGLPPPRLQQIRRDGTGRRRYLDAVWDLPGGGNLVVEIDGALHLAQPKWWADQLRQNEIALSGALVLRFPSAVVRHDQAMVLAQLRRALAPISERRR